MAKVIVGCKLPNGLVIDIKGKGRVHLQGSNAASLASSPALYNPRTAESAPEAVGLTMVEETFWKSWCAQMKGFPPLENGLIFAATKKRDVLAEAKEKSAIKTGLDRMEKPKPPVVGA
ncbi:hypothetical protein [Entomobacter blattae]|uniref:Uncharacterized protein n=1 Tax=Entomobacter blattae TaxID=2762277 RepID=A0A7H1NR64_9PROT|nr:hypothetical protein [Entomobacter blattae]QNT78274.1 hypothetical protein JGUZn3_10460 [Entomobacter blattae]